MKNNYQGWTAKMELFAPWNAHLRPCLFLDLDTFVLWDISDISGMKVSDLWLIRDFYVPERSNSGMMVIPKDTSEIWASFLTKDLNGFADGNFLTTFPHKVLQDHFTGIVSYKADQCYDIPKGRVLCFHGEPKPHDCEGWVSEVWNSKQPLRTLRTLCLKTG